MSVTSSISSSPTGCPDRRRALLALAATLALSALAGVTAAAARAEETAAVHLDVGGVLQPGRHRLDARVRIGVPAALLEARGGRVRFTLHAGLSPASLTEGVTLHPVDAALDGVTPEEYEALLPPGVHLFDLAYGGVINHPLAGVGEEYARGQKTTEGLIGADGAYLSPASLWYPVTEGPPVTFTVELGLPGGWDAVSQGRRTRHERDGEGTRVRWECDRPQQGIYLSAGPLTSWEEDAGGTTAMVFLREDEPKLARTYLDATRRYLRMYQDLLGPYPYAKFALVENFWETGYGMPSFTLLGPRVVRFPFIINSSYPHEILHNWWGNGVFIDYGTGNWGEGLTAYLSDHLIKEQRGAGAEYRETTLQKYADYVLAGRDLPLREFRSRHGSVSEAVGYGKSLMLFHMLRLRLGDDRFREGLRRLAADYLFRTASFNDVRGVFEEVAGEDLADAFSPWIERAGAPSLSVASAMARREGERNLLTFTLEQTQKEDVFPVRIPVAVTLEGVPEALQTVVEMVTKSAEMQLPLPAPPLRLDVDPGFDVFRRLDRREIPPALSQVFGASRALIILPSAAAEPLAGAYRDLAGALSRSGPGEEIRIAADNEFERLPPGVSLWILGWENRWFGAVRGALPPSARVDDTSVRLGSGELPRADHAFVLTARAADGELANLWIGLDDPAAAPGLGRKLPHYHKYSYLAFEGTEPENVAKGRWPVSNSPLTVTFGAAGEEAPTMGTLEERHPLVSVPPEFSTGAMMESIRALTSPGLEGRGFGTVGLERAAAYIKGRFAEAGLEPAGDDGGWYQGFGARGGEPARDVVLRNVVGVIRGTRPQWEGQSIVVGAHYDGLGRGWPDVRAGFRGDVHPGADDNASGVAVLLELARLIGAGPGPERTIIFVAFAGEEAGRLGSRHFVESPPAASPVKGIRAMVNLDTIGRLGDRKLLVIGGDSAREWVHVFRGAGYMTGVEVEMASGDLDASDQVSFYSAGIPAVQLFAGPHLDYHRPGDTVEKIDPAGLVKAAAVARETVIYLAGRPEPLTPGKDSRATGGGDSHAAGKERRVSLGTVPDFSFHGPGVRLEGVVPDSPAEAAGLRSGDVVVRLGGCTVDDLRGLSDILREYDPGDSVEIEYRRGSSTARATVTLEAR